MNCYLQDKEKNWNKNDLSCYVYDVLAKSDVNLINHISKFTFKNSLQFFQ